MKFPISRETLQAFDYAKEQEELKEEEVQKAFINTIDIICKEVRRSIYTNSNEKKYIWRNLHLIRNLHTEVRFPIGSYIKRTTMDEYLPRFIDMLKETFIGCDIIIDPLKTYIIIDWS